MRAHRTRGLTVLLLMIAILAWRCTPAATPTPDPISIAEARAQEGKYTAAEALYREAAQIMPDDPRPALKLAALYRTWKRPRNGLTALYEATQKGATANQTAHLRLELLAMAQNWPQVIVEAKTQLEVAPKDALALKVLTQADLQQYRCVTATQTAQRWREATPEDLNAAKTWGALANDTVSLCKADEQLCTIVTANCEEKHDTQLGIALIRTGDWSLAACVLSRAVAENHATAETYAWLGEALARIGRADEARVYLIEATLLAPKSPLVWLLLGTYDLQHMESEAAEKALLRAHQLDPGNPSPCLALAGVRAQTGQYDEVNVWLKAATNAAPTDVEVWKAAARFDLERHLTDDEFPLRAIQNALQLAPGDGEAYMLLGWFRLLQGDAPGALTALDEAVALAPRLGHARYLHGQALQATGEMEDAQRAFTRAADLGYRP